MAKKKRGKAVARRIERAVAALKLTPEAVAGSRRLRKRKKAAVAPPTTAKAIFAPMERPPWIPKDVPKMAMDDAISQSTGWAVGQFNSIFAEGLAFLGYPLLAELAQRAEYRRGVETLATDMTRKGIKVKATSTDEDADEKADRVKMLEAMLKRLQIMTVLKKAVELDGFFGRGHVYLDTDDTDDRDELQTPLGTASLDDEVSKAKVSPEHALKALRAIEPVWTYPLGYNTNDPLRSDWYKPQIWQVMAKPIHEHRLLTIVSREVPDLLKPAYSFGGLSLTQMAKPYVDNWLNTRQAVADIIESFSVFVLATDLQALLASAADGEQLDARIEMFLNHKNNQGLMVVNKDKEEFSNISAPLSSLDALQAQVQEHMAAVFAIPIVKLFGIQPTGLNASSDGEIRMYYDWVHSQQELVLDDPIRRILGFAQLSLFGEVDPDITFEFVRLWEMDDVQASQVRKTDAETGQILIEGGVISPEEERKRIGEDPDTLYPGLDVDDMPEPPQEEEPGEGDFPAPAPGGAAPGGGPADDRPKNAPPAQKKAA